MHQRIEFIEGPYRTPRVRIGQTVRCSVRGDVEVVAISDTLIPWPIGKLMRARSPVIFEDLERALRVESAVAICHWWGVTGQTVTRWRKALGLNGQTEGLRRLQIAYGEEPTRAAARREGLRAADLAESRAKMAETKRGIPRPDSLKVKVRKALLGRKLSEETRQKMRDARRRYLERRRSAE